MNRLRLVADDLTGALDAAAPFTGLLGSIPCMLDLRSDWPAEGNLAVNAACRDGTEAEAVAASAATMPLFAGAAIAFKKVDSLLRGHWAAELAVLARSHAFAHIVFCPAFPAQKRITRAGRQWMEGPDATWLCLDIDPAEELARHGLKVAHGVAREIDAAGDADVLLCDAESDADLAALTAVGRGLKGPVLWCGSGGLARALAGRSPVPLRPDGEPHLVIVGTHHPVSRGQIAHLHARAPEYVVAIDDDTHAGGKRIEAALGETGRCLVVFSLPDRTPTAEAAASIAARLRHIVLRLAAPAWLTVVGGETYLALCRALGTERLSLDGEFSPGLPVSKLVGGRWDGVPVLSKSGGFGHAATLANLLLPPAHDGI